LKKTSWFGKLLTLLILIAIIAGAAYFLGWLKPESLGAVGAAFAPRDAFLEEYKTRQAAFEKQNAAQLLTYKDAARGYSLKYPVGYMIEKNAGALREAEPDVDLRVWADSPFSAGEIATVRVFDGSFTDAEFAEALAALGSSDVINEVTLNRSAMRDGRKVYFYRVTEYVTAIDEFVYSRNAIFPDCKDASGKTYSALVSFAVPETLDEDLDLADFFVYSFKC
jgi:hypothetical protein